MILHIINISTILDYKCQWKYVVDPTWRFKTFIVIIFITKSISVLQNLLICCRWLHKHIGHVSDGHFLFYNYVRPSPHVVSDPYTHEGYQPYWQFITNNLESTFLKSNFVYTENGYSDVFFIKFYMVNRYSLMRFVVCE